MMKGQIGAVIKSLGLLGFQSTDKKKKNKISEVIADLELDMQKLKDQEPTPSEAEKMTNDDALAIIKPFGDKLKTLRETYQIK